MYLKKFQSQMIPQQITFSNVPPHPNPKVATSHVQVRPNHYYNEQ